mmetsp:Transcript_14828/g.22319  ORF Transcript_14828/g.22319 Transcript_14828/m.22319 type:complete len:116 (+) Transcript_14828:53-400(+)
MSKFFSVAAGLSGAVAIGLGAYGAHGIKHMNESYRDTWKIASLYHLVHSVALAGVAVNLHGRKRQVCGTLFLTGIVLFCGSCYTVSFLEERKPYSYVAPYGGISLMLGWLAFAFL